MVDFSENQRILDRVAETLNLTGHGYKKKLAAYLKVSEVTLSAWRTRNAIDYDKLREKLTPEQFIYATTGTKDPASTFEPSELVARTEFLEQMLKMSKRIDRLEAALGIGSAGKK